ncbi:DUF1211 domain-containing membrane protein [Ktedonobacter sp. SOSP1-52]|uniref:TMEM175 family protein n=1 Tax=Ktedonobacter sp. SOSP1-52 TaxID=2778366 RepID=UPI00191664DB|nr:TMEM175 family protein [Ktedonobacter sp. SOSP1-52]GHO69305.1 DUF1211 domain-containing membrane protein [Ktedonobacter sp. SOSP1-52]
MDEKKETSRVEAFSDGVFAIAITLLILDVTSAFSDASKLQLFDLLRQQWTVLLAFLLSFATIGIMWLNHHRLFTLIVRADHNLLVLNLLLLLAATVVPFPTALLGRYGVDVANNEANFKQATILYNGVFLFVALGYHLLWLYATYKGRLLSPNVNMEAVRRIDRQYLLGPLFYTIAFALAFVNPWISLAVNTLLAIFFLLPGIALSTSQKPE